jgi:GT2 family glycosyltransferase
VVDVERLPDEIPATGADGRRYAGLWLLVRSGGEPRELLRVPLSGSSLPRAQLEHLTAGIPHAPAAAGPEPAPRVSVVVCSVMSREDELLAALRSLAALEYPDFELLLVDNRPGVHDGPALPDDLRGVRVLREPRPGLSHARNRGLQEAGGSIVAYTDDDVIADSRWLTALTRRFAQGDCACVTGLVLPADLRTAAQAAFEAYYGGFGPRTLRPLCYELEGGPRRRVFGAALVTERDEGGEVRSRFPLYNVGRFGVGANMAYRTDVLRAAGGFNPALGAGTPARGGEDIGMFARLLWQGRRLCFDPAAVVLHRHRASDEELARQIEAYGLGLTATLTALVGEDVRHLGAMVSTAPLALRVLARSMRRKHRLPPGGGPGAQAASSFAALARLEMRAMIRGPAAYARSARGARRT